MTVADAIEDIFTPAAIQSARAASLALADLDPVADEGLRLAILTRLTASLAETVAEVINELGGDAEAIEHYEGRAMLAFGMEFDRLKLGQAVAPLQQGRLIA